MTGRDRIVLMIVLSVGAIGAFWFAALSPKRSEATSAQQQLSAAQQRLDTANQTLAQGQGAQAAYSTAYTTLARLGKAVPSDDQVPSLIYELSHAATTSGVAFDKVSVGGGPGAGTAATASTAGAPALAGLKTMPLTFTFEGNFFHLAGFFRTIDQFIVARQNELIANGRLLTLDSVSLAPGAGGFPQITAQVSATGFELPAQQTGAAAGAVPNAAKPAIGSTPTGSPLPALPAASATGALP